MKTITHFLLALFLTAIATLATAQVPSYVPTSGLKAWYPLDGNGNDAYGSYSTSVVGPGIPSTTNRFGASGSASNFTGTSYYSHSGSLPISGTAFTISVWVRSNGTGEANGIFSQWDPASTLSGTADNVGFQTGIGTATHAGQLEYSFKREAINTSINYSPLTIAVDTFWKNLIITYDGSDTLTVYVNGAVTYTIDAINIPTSIGTMATLECIGKIVNAGTDVKFIGDMDDLGIWNRILTPCERWRIVNSIDTAMHPITGPSVVCDGSSVTLSDATTGGTWTNGSFGITSIGSSSGIVTGLLVGTDTITYTRNFGACGTSIETATVTVNQLPNAGTISGPSIVYVGSSITLTDPAAGGTWSSTNSRATVIGGTVTGVTYGTDTVLYVVTNSCGSDTATQTVLVDTVSSTLITYTAMSQDTFKIYPIPAMNTITLVTSNPIVTVTIIDQTGRPVLVKNDSEIDVTALAAGQYILIVQTAVDVTKHCILIVH